MFYAYVQLAITHTHTYTMLATASDLVSMCNGAINLPCYYVPHN